MAISIQLKIEEYLPASKTSEYFEVKVRAINLIPYLKDEGWVNLLNPNVRKPKENLVTMAIANSIRSAVALGESYEIPNPITITAFKYKTDSLNLRLNLVEPGENGREIGDGVLDGGHRLLVFKKLHRENPQFLSEVYVNLRIYFNLTDERIRSLAIALNTSGKVRKSSLKNYEGEYDWVKDLLKVGYPFIRYYENEPETYGDPYCSIERVFALTLLLDPVYKLNSLDGKRHPISIARSSGTSGKQIPRVQKMSHLMLDALFLQGEVARQLNDLTITKELPFVEMSSSRKCTHLPDGKLLSCKLPSKLYVYPIVSSFRLLLHDNHYWKVNDMKKIAPRIIEKQIKRFVQILGQQASQKRASESILTHEYIWDQMCKVIVEDEMCKVFFREYSPDAPNLKLVG